MDGPIDYEPSDRRPIAQRKWPMFQVMATQLANAGVSANAISLIGMTCGVAAGGLLFSTTFVPAIAARFLWAMAAGLIQLRLLANMLDGMVAVSTGTASPVGELYNELPDRVSDSAVLVGLGYAAVSSPALGWAAALAAMMTAYVRALGKGAGAPSEFCGPMAKQQRMFLVTALSLVVAFTPTQWHAWRPAAWVLAIIAIGSAATIIRRLVRIARNLRGTM